MSAPRAVALFSAPRVDAGGLEALRVLASLVGRGATFPLVELGPGRGVLRSDAVPPDAERYLDAMAALGVVPTTLDPAGLRRALLDADLLVRAADPSRRGTPPVLDLTDAWLSSVSDTDLLDALQHAGQVIRVR